MSMNLKRLSWENFHQVNFISRNHLDMTIFNVRLRWYKVYIKAGFEFCVYALFLNFYIEILFTTYCIHV